MNFIKFKNAVAKQFEKIAKNDLFRSYVSKEDIWNTYLSSFPEGSDPIYVERTEHDCNCCKQFIRGIGNVVAIIDGKIETIWDISIGDEEPEYQIVADALAKLVRSAGIYSVFLTAERTYGTDKSFMTLDAAVHGKSVQQWDHFFLNVPRKFIVNAGSLGNSIGEANSSHQVFSRSLKEITKDSVETVLELVAANSIYRGKEHEFVLKEFLKLKKAYDKIATEEEKINFAWYMMSSVPASIQRIRNTSIGTLLTDISEDMDLEDAVKKFEVMVAPTNYKRTNAIVTPKMVENAKKEIQSLGLESALSRRYAELSDISVNDILFVDRGVSSVMKDADVFDQIAVASTKKTKNFDGVETITIDKFINDILPTATSLEVMFTERDKGKLVSLVAPSDPTSESMFKWNNRFSWSYVGDVTDAIKERVKSVGGNVTGELLCRLAWYNNNDLDFHLVSRNDKLYFGNKRKFGACLDVDMMSGGTPEKPSVENIFVDSLSNLQEGEYTLRVNSWSIRTTNEPGFDVQIEYDGEIFSFHSKRHAMNGGNIDIAKITYKKGKLEIKPFFDSTASERTSQLWNIETGKFHKCNVFMNSPNHWENAGGVGNKHYFFMLESCVNDGNARGFYNEFLKEDLNKHRKVMEIVGSKMRTNETPNQLSGIGFSETGKGEVVVRVTGKTKRMFKVKI